MDGATRVLCLTISTDASHSPAHGVGSFAFQIVCNAFRVAHSGVLTVPISRIVDAEVAAIAEALYSLLLRPSLPHCGIIVINTDCLVGIHHIEKGVSDAGLEVQTLIRKVKERMGYPTVRLRHVKAHSKKRDSRSMANRWCDKAAKRSLRQRVFEIELNQLL